MQREEINFLAQFAKKNDLKNLYEKIVKKSKVIVLSSPTEQTLLQPVKDPISNGSFYGGEILVTSCMVQVDGEKGWAMVMDIDKKKALHVATLDGAFAKGIMKDEIITLLENTSKKITKDKEEENRKINSTKVSFDLM